MDLNMIKAMMVELNMMVDFTVFLSDGWDRQVIWGIGECGGSCVGREGVGEGMRQVILGVVWQLL